MVILSSNPKTTELPNFVVCTTVQEANRIPREHYRYDEGMSAARAEWCFIKRTRKSKPDEKR